MLNIQKNITLAPYTTFHIGGPADEFVMVKTTEELVEAIEYAQEKNIHYFVLGSGANILVGDKGFRGLVIKNDSHNTSIINDQLSTDSGTTIEELINITAPKGLSGFEHFAGIPSTIGGALWQNLHFLGPDRHTTVYIGDMVISAEILLSDSTQIALRDSEFSDNPVNRVPSESHLNTKTVDKDYFKFAYDYSILRDTNDIVLSATFKLTHEKREIIESRIRENLQWRQEKHPEHAPEISAGSIFKKLEGYGAGRLIEKVGLKGHKIGGAMVSSRHANFIVNTGNATAKDVHDMIELIQKTVKEQLGLTLETEISFIGEF